MVTVPTVASTGSLARRPLVGGRHTVAIVLVTVLAAAVGGAALAGRLAHLSLTTLGVVAAWPLLLQLVGGRPPVAGSRARHHRQAVLRVAVTLAVLHWLFAPALDADRLELGLAIATLALLTLTATAMAEGAQRRAGVLPRALVVGDDPELRVLMSQVAVAAGRSVDVVGGCAPEEVSVTLEQLEPDVVVVVPSPTLSGRALQRLAWQLERGRDGAALPMLLLSGLQDVALRRSRTLELGGLGVTQVTAVRHSGPMGLAKVVWERSAAALALALLAPLLLLVMLLVRLDSPGPALFRQTRVGRDGRHFTMLKLRTMRTDAEAVRQEVGNDVDEVLFKNRTDPRITRLGRVLRRYSLDELPQLVNVLRGEMSLVGPRPALPSEVAAYDHDPLRRLAVRPGLTGLWQVSGRSDLTWCESVRLDLDYVDNWSLRRDLAIVGRTVQAVLGHRGAY